MNASGTIEQVVNPGRTVHTVRADASAAQAAEKMYSKRIGCLMVIDDSGCVVGILSERDIVSKVVAQSIAPSKVTVSDIMTPKVLACTMRTPLAKAEKMMTKHHMRHLPVIDNGIPVGMISSRDLMAHQLSDVQNVVRRQSQVLDEIEATHPGITELARDSYGRIII